MKSFKGSLAAEQSIGLKIGADLISTDKVKSDKTLVTIVVNKIFVGYLLHIAVKILGIIPKVVIFFGLKWLLVLFKSVQSGDVKRFFRLIIAS